MSLMHHVQAGKAKHATHVAHVKGHHTAIHKAIHLPKGPNLAGHNTHMPAHPKAGYFTVK